MFGINLIKKKYNTKTISKNGYNKLKQQDLESPRLREIFLLVSYCLYLSNGHFYCPLL